MIAAIESAVDNRAAGRKKTRRESNEKKKIVGKRKNEFV
jgi:hypothetical protein